jgi:hypothetical protein
MIAVPDLAGEAALYRDVRLPRRTDSKIEFGEGCAPLCTDLSNVA